MRLLLSPIVDVTHCVFRDLVAHFGGCDVFISEMINVRMLRGFSPRKDPYLFFGEKDQPLFLQLVGGSSRDFAEAVDLIERELTGFYGYNLNFACSRGRIQRFGWGASLLNDPESIREILRAVRSRTSKPVSVKLRSPDHDLKKLFRIFEVLEEERVFFVVFHPRSPDEGFSKRAVWREIAEVKKRFSLTVFGNGDVFSPEDALRMIEETNADGVAIARAAAIRPWIFRDIRLFAEGKELPPGDPAFCVRKIFLGLKDRFSQNWAEKRFDLFLFWFLQNYSNAHFYLKKLRKLSSAEEKFKFALEIAETDKLRSYPVTPFLWGSR